MNALNECSWQCFAKKRSVDAVIIDLQQNSNSFAKLAVLHE
jgi:hypothetical protein